MPEFQSGWQESPLHHGNYNPLRRSYYDAETAHLPRGTNVPMPDESHSQPDSWRKPVDSAESIVPPIPVEPAHPNPVERVAITPEPAPAPPITPTPPPPTNPPRPGVYNHSEVYDTIKRTLHSRLIEKLDLAQLNSLSPEQQRTDLGMLIERMVSTESRLGHTEQEQLTQELLNEILGFGPLEKLLADPYVSDILVNGPTEIFVERKGQLEPADVRFRDSEHVLQILDRIVSKVGRRVDEASPLVDARLPDGSRVNAVIYPIALKGPVISIRRFGTKPLRLQDLIDFNAFTPEMAILFEGAIKARLNVIISGGTGSGKTTLLNTLSAFIPAHERIVTIEDAAELQLQQRHVVPLETRPPNIEGKGQITTRDLVRNALRMRPDRIVIGECRGGEALDMLQAMNTGHDGSLTTLHANSPRDALGRLETMMLMAGFELPIKAMRQQVGSAVNLIIQASRLQGGPRRVTHVTELVGLEGDVIILQDIFNYEQLGVSADGRAIGHFRATGVRPTFTDRLIRSGFHIPEGLFAERVLLQDI